MVICYPIFEIISVENETAKSTFRQSSIMYVLTVTKSQGIKNILIFRNNFLI